MASGQTVTSSGDAPGSRSLKGRPLPGPWVLSSLMLLQEKIFRTHQSSEYGSLLVKQSKKKTET
jgi:hypothetical protein